MNEEESTLFRPFGPTIFKVKIPEKIIQELNVYVDGIIKDKEKSKEPVKSNGKSGSSSEKKSEQKSDTSKKSKEKD